MCSLLISSFQKPPEDFTIDKTQLKAIIVHALQVLHGQVCTPIHVRYVVSMTLYSYASTCVGWSSGEGGCSEVQQ